MTEPRPEPHRGNGQAYWARPVDELFKELGSHPTGLSSDEAAERLRRDGPNELRERTHVSRLGVLIAQLRNPLLWLLVAAALISAVTGEWVDASIVFAIVVASVAIGYQREYTAQSAAEARHRCF